MIWNRLAEPILIKFHSDHLDINTLRLAPQQSRYYFLFTRINFFLLEKKNHTYAFFFLRRNLTNEKWDRLHYGTNRNAFMSRWSERNFIKIGLAVFFKFARFRWRIKNALPNSPTFWLSFWLNTKIVQPILIKNFVDHIHVNTFRWAPQRSRYRFWFPRFR